MSAKSTMSKATKTKWLITILCTVAVALIPAVGLYTPQMRMFMIITVFSLFIIAFEFFAQSVMAIFLPVLYGIFNVAPTSVVMQPWVGDNMLLILGVFAFCAILESSGALTRIAYYLLSKVNGSFIKLLIAIYLVGVFLTIITFGTAHLFMAPLCAGLCLSLGAMKKKGGAAIAMACMLGTCSAKAFTYPITFYAVIRASAGELAAETFANMNMLSVMLHNCPMFFVCLITLFIVAKWYKPEEDLNGSEYFKIKLSELGPITRREKMVGVLLIAILAYTIQSSFTGMNANYGFMFIPWLAFFPFINAADAETMKKMNWDMIFFIGGCMSIGTVAGSLGFAAILSDVMGSVFSQGNVFAIFGGLFAIVFTMNFLMTPFAMWALLSAPLMQVAIDLGINQLPLIYALVSTSEAIILPYEYAPYLVVYGFGMITMKDFVKLSIMRCAIYIIGFFVVLIPFWMLIGII